MKKTAAFYTSATFFLFSMCAVHQARALQAQVPPRDHARAVEILTLTDSKVAALPPAMRAYLRFQLGKAYSGVSNTKSIQNLVDALTASEAIEDDSDTKQQLQGWIVEALLGKGVKDLDEFLSSVEPSVRESLSFRQVRIAVQQGKFDEALSLLVSGTYQTFPYDPAARLLEHLPPERSHDRVAVIEKALQVLAQNPRGGLSVYGMPRLIERSWRRLPPDLVLKAVDETLAVAKSEDDNNPAQPMTLGTLKGSVSFTSYYEAALFQFLPILKTLDEDRAKRLLNEYPQLVPKLARYPEGGLSLDPESENAGRNDFSVTLHAPGSAADLTDDRAETDLMAHAQRIATHASSNPRQALATAETLPRNLPSGNSPRAEALLGIARQCAADAQKISREALRELVKTVADAAIMTRLKYLGEAATLYMRLRDDEGTLNMIGQGVQMANELFESDTDPKDPNRALKAFWPSAVAWREFSVLAAHISPRRAEQIAWAVPDEEIRLNTLIAIANAMLDGRAATAIIADERNSGTKIRSSFSLPTRQ